MKKGQHPEPPGELSRQAAARWQEQADALVESGRLTAPRLELLSAWATAIDARDRALAQWEEQGSPLEQPGRSGQPRPHHLKVSLERAEAQLASLTAKIERSAARRESKRPDGLPIGARRIEVEGEPEVVVDADGRLLSLGVQTGRWQLAWLEVEYDDGAKLRWVDEHGRPVFWEVPPWRLPAEGGPATPLPWPEVEVWCERVGVPVEAAREWYGRDRRWPSRITWRSDVTLDRILGARNPPL